MGPPQLPSRIGYEAAGVIDAIGEGVAGWAVGGRVATLPGLSMEDYGTYADLILYPADMLIRHPDGLSLDEAAAAWMQYLTAYAIIGVADLQPGDAVLITAASSSVGLAAIQIANLVGATPIAVTRGEGKRAALTAQGARHVIVGDGKRLAEAVASLTGGAGARVIFDAVGGETLPSLVDAAATGGWIILYGSLAGAVAPLPLPYAMLKGLTIRGFAMNQYMADPEHRRRALAFVTEGLESGRLKPVIDRTFDLDEIVAAHRYLESNAQIGKILVRAAASAT
jgi:NADPH:quinone reductase-like Zn-dependent oxidoreductase